MKFDWNPEKNEWLRRERNISFEEIALLLAKGILWKTVEHPNKKKYPEQKAFLVLIDNYVYLVPYVIDQDTIFLKTAFRHRKATRDFRKEREYNE